MPKRDRPEFYYDEKRKLYRKRIDIDGKQKDVYGKTPQEVREKIFELTQAQKLGLVLDEKTTLAEYAVRWYETVSVKWVYKTQERESLFLNKHILPELGAMKLRDIKPLHVQGLFAKKSDLARDTQKGILRTLKTIFKSAQENGLVARSPCVGIALSGAEREQKTPLTAEQQAALIEMVKGTRVYPFIMLGLYAGLRREEILGLMWDCVHLDEKVPYISVRRVVRFEETDGVLSDQLKTRDSRRDIPIPPQLVECLRGAKSRASSLFVCPGTGGKHCGLAAYRQLWKFVERRDPPFYVTPHILRHTYITNLCAAGMDIKKIQYLAGHSNIQMTLNVYSHVTQNTPELMGEIINGVFSGQISGQNKNDESAIDCGSKTTG